MLEPQSFELTIEQQFEYARMQREAANMGKEQILELLLEACKLMMLKDNMIRGLARKAGCGELMVRIEYQIPDGEMG